MTTPDLYNPSAPDTALFSLSSSSPHKFSGKSALSYASTSSSTNGAPAPAPSPSSKRKHLDVIDRLYPQQQRPPQPPSPPPEPHQTHHAADYATLTPSFGLRSLRLEDSGASVIQRASNNVNRKASAAAAPSYSSYHPKKDEAADDDDEDSDDGVDSGSAESADMWSCFYGCGKTYRKSSGRSIRRHVMHCFRLHWPGGDRLTDAEVSALISREQDAGHLVTGLRRWRMRQSRRAAGELAEHEKWKCPWECGQFYRSTSSRSIQRHAAICPLRQKREDNDTAQTQTIHQRTGSNGAVSENQSADAAAATGAGANAVSPSMSDSDDLIDRSIVAPKRRNQTSPTESTSESNSSTPESYRTTVDDRRQQDSDERSPQFESDNLSVIKRERISPQPHSHATQNPAGNKNNGHCRTHSQSSKNVDHLSLLSASDPVRYNERHNGRLRQYHRSGGGGTNSSGLHQYTVSDVYTLSPSTSPAPDSAVTADDVMSYSANLSTLHEQQKSVVMQLQTLLKSLFARYGTTHPVFSQPWMTTPLLNRLLGDDLSTTDSQSLISDIFAHLSSHNTILLSSMTHDAASSASSPSSSSSPSRSSDLPSSSMFRRGDRALSFPPPLTPDNSSNNAYDSAAPLLSAPALSHWRSSPTPQLSPASTTSPSSSAAASHRTNESIQSAYTHTQHADVAALFTPSINVRPEVSTFASGQSLMSRNHPGLTSRRNSVTLTVDQLTWTCPTAGCTQSYKITSTKSIEKHKYSCPHGPQHSIFTGADDDGEAAHIKAEHFEKRPIDEQQMRVDAYHALVAHSLALQQQHQHSALAMQQQQMDVESARSRHFSQQMSSNMYEQHNRHAEQLHKQTHRYHHSPRLHTPPTPLSVAPSPSNAYQLLSSPFDNTTAAYAANNRTASANAHKFARSMQFAHGNAQWTNNDSTPPPLPNNYQTQFTNES